MCSSAGAVSSVQKRCGSAAPSCLPGSLFELDGPVSGLLPVEFRGHGEPGSLRADFLDLLHEPTHEGPGHVEPGYRLRRAAVRSSKTGSVPKSMKIRAPLPSSRCRAGRGSAVWCARRSPPTPCRCAPPASLPCAVSLRRSPRPGVRTGVCPAAAAWFPCHGGPRRRTAAPYPPRSRARAGAPEPSWKTGSFGRCGWPGIRSRCRTRLSAAFSYAPCTRVCKHFITGKSALITGGFRSIGAGTARSLAAQDATVASPTGPPPRPANRSSRRLPQPVARPWTCGPFTAAVRELVDETNLSYLTDAGVPAPPLTRFNGDRRAGQRSNERVHPPVEPLDGAVRQVEKPSRRGGNQPSG